MPAAMGWGAKASAVPTRERETRAVLSFMFILVLASRELGRQNWSSARCRNVVLSNRSEGGRSNSNFGKSPVKRPLTTHLVLRTKYLRFCVGGRETRAEVTGPLNSAARRPRFSVSLSVFNAYDRRLHVPDPATMLQFITVQPAS